MMSSSEFGWAIAARMRGVPDGVRVTAVGGDGSTMTIPNASVETLTVADERAARGPHAGPARQRVFVIIEAHYDDTGTVVTVDTNRPAPEVLDAIAGRPAEGEGQ